MCASGTRPVREAGPRQFRSADLFRSFISRPGAHAAAAAAAAGQVSAGQDLA